MLYTIYLHTIIGIVGLAFELVVAVNVDLNDPIIPFYRYINIRYYATILSVYSVYISYFIYIIYAVYYMSYICSFTSFVIHTLTTCILYNTYILILAPNVYSLLYILYSQHIHTCTHNIHYIYTVYLSWYGACLCSSSGSAGSAS